MRNLSPLESLSPGRWPIVSAWLLSRFVFSAFTLRRSTMVCFGGHFFGFLVIRAHLAFLQILPNLGGFQPDLLKHFFSVSHLSAHLLGPWGHTCQVMLQSHGLLGCLLLCKHIFSLFFKVATFYHSIFNSEERGPFPSSPFCCWVHLLSSFVCSFQLSYFLVLIIPFGYSLHLLFLCWAFLFFLTVYYQMHISYA